MRLLIPRDKNPLYGNILLFLLCNFLEDPTYVGTLESECDPYQLSISIWLSQVGHELSYHKSPHSFPLHWLLI